MMMAQQRPEWKIGVSTWGQGDAEKLIWVKDHFKNLSKIKKHQKDASKVRERNGVIEYYQPALSWTKRFKKGNLKDIIRCNELNFQAFVTDNDKPDLILVQGTYPGILVGEYLSDKYDVPYHLHIRLGGFMFEHLLNDLGGIKGETLSAIERARKVTVTSHFQQNELQNWVPQAEVIYNPVDTDFFDLSNENGQYVLAIGRLEHEKGFDLLLEAIQNLPDVKLKIIGEGSQKENLLEKSSRLKLDDRVEFIGEKTREEVRRYIHKCQFLVLPSRYETFGNVVLEAMACGKPVVATRCGGPEEILTEYSGVLCDKDVTDLGSAIHEMVKTYSEYSPEKVREEAVSRFGVTEWFRQLEQIFKEGISK